MTGAVARPDWVMLGIPEPDGAVSLYASKDLTSSQLRTEAEHEDVVSHWSLDDPIRRDVRSSVIWLSAGMKTFVVIYAPDYLTAFRDLMKFWSPAPDRPELDAAPLSLDWGRADG